MVNVSHIFPNFIRANTSTKNLVIKKKDEKRWGSGVPNVPEWKVKTHIQYYLGCQCWVSIFQGHPSPKTTDPLQCLPCEPCGNDLQYKHFFEAKFFIKILMIMKMEMTTSALATMGNVFVPLAVLRRPKMHLMKKRCSHAKEQEWRSSHSHAKERKNLILDYCVLGTWQSLEAVLWR